jgi:rare lipoprotein A
MMRRALGLSVLLGLIALTGCGKKPRVTVPTRPIQMHQEGLASWYGKGDGYNGKRTASGERFDRDKLTAAHFSLPFGTLVKVRNKRNGREVTVRINDRFPIETLRKGRIIDLSFKAAEKLRMIRDGVVPVELRVVKLPGSG